MYSVLDNELASYPVEVIGDAKRHAGLSDRDPQSLTTEEKQIVLHHAARLRQNPPNGSVAGPSGFNTHGQLPNRRNRGPMSQSMQAQLSMPQWNSSYSTSPGEQHPTLPRNAQFPPDNKRPSRTPNPAEKQQQQPQQSQPPPPPPTSLQVQQIPLPPMGVINPQQMAQYQVLYQGQYRGLVNPQVNSHKGNPNTPVHPLDPQSHLRGPGPGQPVPNRLSGGPADSVTHLIKSLEGLGMSEPQKPGGKEGERELNAPLNPAAFAPTSGPLHNSAPAPMNPQRPPTSNAPMLTPAPPPPPAPVPVPMGDLAFDMTDMFGSNGGDFDFGPCSLDTMDLWFDSTAVHDSSHAPLNPAASAPTSGPLHNRAPPMNPQRQPTSKALVPALAPQPPPPPPPPGPGPMDDLAFDMNEMFGSNGGDFDFGPTSMDNMDLWLESTAVCDSSIDMK